MQFRCRMRSESPGMRRRLNPRRTIAILGDFLVRLRELQEDYIRKVLAATGNNKNQAAEILGIHPTSLLRRLKQ